MEPIMVVAAALAALALAGGAWYMGKKGEEKRSEEKMQRYKSAVIQAVGDAQVQQLFGIAIGEVLKSDHFEAAIQRHYIPITSNNNVPFLNV